MKSHWILNRFFHLEDGPAYLIAGGEAEGDWRAVGDRILAERGLIQGDGHWILQLGSQDWGYWNDGDIETALVDPTSVFGLSWLDVVQIEEGDEEG